MKEDEKEEEEETVEWRAKHSNLNKIRHHRCGEVGEGEQLGTEQEKHIDKEHEKNHEVDIEIFRWTSPTSSPWLLP